MAIFDDIIQTATGNPTTWQQIWWSKTRGTSLATPIAYSLWRWGGPATFGCYPPAGALPTNGLAGAVVTDRTTVGALPLINAATGAALYLVSGMFSNQEVGSFQASPCYVILFDRLAHARINNDQATGSFSPVIDATARLDTGQGGLIICEVTSALSAATNVRTFTYTNQAGIAGQVTPAWTSGNSAALDQFANISTGVGTSSIFIPLAGQDIGVRSIQSTTLVSGAGTGEFTVSIVRPIAIFTTKGGGHFTVHDFVTGQPLIPLIKNSSCLFFAGSGPSLDLTFMGVINLLTVTVWTTI